MLELVKRMSHRFLLVKARYEVYIFVLEQSRKDVPDPQRSQVLSQQSPNVEEDLPPRSLDALHALLKAFIQTFVVVRL